MSNPPQNGAYAAFLAAKRLQVQPAGRDVPDAALHPLLFPFQRDLVRWALRKGRAALFADTGLGKALDAGTPIATPSGMRAIAELAPGDLVIGANGQPTTVTGVFPQGIRPAYRVTFSDGVSIVCDDEHLWPVRSKGQRYRGQPYRPLTTRQIRDAGLVEQEGWRHFIPMTAPVAFIGGPLPLDPYLLGVLIGDGSLSAGCPVFSTIDDEIVAEVARLVPAPLIVLPDSGCSWRITHGSRNGHRPNPLTDALRALELMGARAEHKFVPRNYLYATIPDRVAMLQGLLDTDGHVSADNNLEFCTVSAQLAVDVVFLVQSLGGRATIRRKKTTGQLAYRMSIALPAGSAPFRLGRKRDVYRDREKYPPTRAIVAIEDVEPREMVCIAVAAADALYVAQHFVVTHNTFMQLEWARLTQERALILAPLAVARQSVREAQKLGIELTYARRQEDAEALTITNYEMMDHFDPAAFGAVVLDESSILKSFEGKTRTRLIERFQQTPFRLCCTATPAPNDIAELANHAEFLGVMSRVEMLATFFVHDDAGWRLKGHAREPFYRWLASWGMSLKSPADLGYDAGAFRLPPLHIHPVLVEMEQAPPDRLFAVGLGGVQDRAQIRQSTLPARVRAAVERITAEPEEPWLVWVGLNEEGRELARLLPGSTLVEGSQSPEEKADKLEQFVTGATRILVTKISIAGFGLNFQHCARMAFVGLSDSYEAYYQAIRRCWRFGQRRPVRADIVLSEAEQAIHANVLRKEAEAEHTSREMIRHLAAYEHAEIAGQSQRMDYQPGQVLHVPAWLKGTPCK